MLPPWLRRGGLAPFMALDGTGISDDAYTQGLAATLRDDVDVVAALLLGHLHILAAPSSGATIVASAEGAWTSVALRPRGDIAAIVGGPEGTIARIDVAPCGSFYPTTIVEKCPRGAMVCGQAWTDADDVSIVGGGDGGVAVVDHRMRRAAARTPRPHYAEAARAVAYRPHTIAVGRNDGSLCQWAIADLRAPLTTDEETHRGGAVTSVAYAPDGSGDFASIGGITDATIAIHGSDGGLEAAITTSAQGLGCVWGSSNALITTHGYSAEPPTTPLVQIEEYAVCAWRLNRPKDNLENRHPPIRLHDSCTQHTSRPLHLSSRGTDGHRGFVTAAGGDDQTVRVWGSPLSTRRWKGADMSLAQEDTLR